MSLKHCDICSATVHASHVHLSTDITPPETVCVGCLERDKATVNLTEQLAEARTLTETQARELATLDESRCELWREFEAQGEQLAAVTRERDELKAERAIDEEQMSDVVKQYAALTAERDALLVRIAELEAGK